MSHDTHPLTSTERRAGAWYGLAVGDALGAPVEFMSAAQVAAADPGWMELAGGGPWDPGEQTDDTDLTLANAAAYAPNGAFDVFRAARAATAWLHRGPKDVGNLTADALRMIMAGHADARSAGQLALQNRPGSAGNGSLMRCAPTGLARHYTDPRLVSEAEALSAYTHADERCTAACVAFCGVLSALVHDGADAQSALRVGANLATGRSREVDAIMQAVLHRSPLLYHDAPMGYVLLTLERALVALRDAPDYAEGVLTVIRMGGDTDTNACVAGAALGARFGLSGIPARWRERIANPERLAAALAQLPDPRNAEGADPVSRAAPPEG